MYLIYRPDYKYMRLVHICLMFSDDLPIFSIGFIQLYFKNSCVRNTELINHNSNKEKQKSDRVDLI